MVHSIFKRYMLLQHRRHTLKEGNEETAARAQFGLQMSSLMKKKKKKKKQSGCAPSEDSHQPWHPPSLIRVFAVRSRVAKDPSFLHADSEDSDQTGRMPKLIRVFAERIVILLVCHVQYLFIVSFDVVTLCLDPFPFPF